MAPNLVSSYCRPNHSFTWQTLLEFALLNVSGSTKLAVDRVSDVVHVRNLPVADLAQFLSCLTNAIDHAVDRCQKTDSEPMLYLRVLLLEKVQQTSPDCGFFFVEKEVLRSEERRLLEIYLYS